MHLIHRVNACNLILITLISLRFHNSQQFMTTDIDRKLAIYYHPLFQQTIRCITRLFKQGDNMEIGLLEFIEFNLKLQKALLPAFQKQNAIVSGLNDWVKQVAECLTYQGMVSTNRCVDITSQNFVTVLQREMENIKIKLFSQKDEYIKTMIKLSSHDAFKLLGVRINKQVFSKFMFDLCSTWCQFLDVQLFSYFLFGLYIQISKGQTLEDSQFAITEDISPVELDFMEEFEQLKSNYNKTRKKQLRYYRAWCQWNYLRVNEIGEALILQLDQVHPEDHRILQIALIFEKAIQVINEQITNQNPITDQQKQNVKTEREDLNNKQFLILKRIDLGPSKQVKKQKEDREKQFKQINKADALKKYYEDEHIQNAENQQDFEIEIDEDGNMYLKRIVKLPIIGVKIQPQLFQNKEKLKQMHLEKKKEQMRQESNLYRKMIAMKVRLEHNPKNDPYAFRKNPKIAERDQFYRKKDEKQKVSKNTKQMKRTIHDKLKNEESETLSKREQLQSQIKQRMSRQVKRDKVPKSIRQENQYIHKVIAPSFLTNDKDNLEYMIKEGKVYSTTVGLEKRNLKIGLPKLNNLSKSIKPLNSYHYIGKLTNDRDKINGKVRAHSNYESTKDYSTNIEKLIEQNEHIIKRYIDEDQLKQLTNYKNFYQKIQVAKKKFGLQFQSEYRRNLKPILLYENRRYQVGGVITQKDHQRFYNRMQRLIRKDQRKKNKRKRRQKNRRFRSVFKDKNDKSLFEDVFLSYHKQALKSIKQQRKLEIVKK